METINHLIEHEKLGLPEAYAVVDAWPNTSQVYASPIAGDPDLASEESISSVTHIVTGFLLPKTGILTSIHMQCQGNTGAGTNRNVRYSVCSIVRDPTASTGLAIGEILLTGVTAVADNASGDITLATGLTLNVPSHFVVTAKAATQFTASNAIHVQNCLSAGPIPGVVGVYSGGLISTATYMSGTTDLDEVTPAAIPAGDKLGVSIFKGLTQWITWRGE